MLRPKIDSVGASCSLSRGAGSQRNVIFSDGMTMANLRIRPNTAWRALACALLVLLTSAHAQRASTALRAGDYLTERAWGTLTLRPGNDRTMLFTIETVGANAHVCALEGEIASGVATLEGIDDKTPCVVNFAPSGDGVRVTARDPDACRDYCGVRAHFEALYVRPAPGCTKPAVAAARSAFRQLYDTRRYAEARAKLEPILTLCSRTLPQSDEARIRNDLAVTFHKLGDFSSCQLVLQPMLDEAQSTEGGATASHGLSGAEPMDSLARAARTNMNLCVGK